MPDMKTDTSPIYKGSDVYEDNLPSLLTLWLPLASILAYAAIFFASGKEAAANSLLEDGPFENFQVLLVGGAFLVGAYILARMPPRHTPWLLGWVLLTTLASLFIAGEEISWGQRLIGWATPEGWADINTHKETNLHNLSGLLNNLPKTLLEYGIYAGVLGVALLRKFKKSWLPEKFAIIYPAFMVSLPSVIMLLALRFGKYLDKALETGFLPRVSELSEIYLYLFMLCYMLVLKNRLAVSTAAAK
ncbi:MAG: hypothetical protein ACAH80_11095 [Alphaproteobacteria bacterium]